MNNLLRPKPLQYKPLKKVEVKFEMLNTQTEYYVKMLQHCSFFKDFHFNLLHCNSYDTTFEDYISRHCHDEVAIGEWINHSFDWSHSEQGRNYWKKISDAWREYVKTDDLKHIWEWYDFDEELTPITIEEVEKKGREAKELANLMGEALEMSGIATDETIDPSFKVGPRKKETAKLNFKL